MEELQLQAEGNKKLRLLFLISFFLVFILKKQIIRKSITEYECLLETRASGLFQNQRKFLKETQFFPYKTIMSFSNNFLALKRKR